MPWFPNQHSNREIGDPSGSARPGPAAFASDERAANKGDAEPSASLPRPAATVARRGGIV